MIPIILRLYHTLRPDIFEFMLEEDSVKEKPWIAFFPGKKSPDPLQQKGSKRSVFRLKVIFVILADYPSIALLITVYYS